MQCIKPYRFRWIASVNFHVEHQNVLLVPDGLVWVFRKVRLSWDFLPRQSPEFNPLEFCISVVISYTFPSQCFSLWNQVTVPISIKGRIILEILEGMVYLTDNQVIHKDLKPENILVDEHFHIKVGERLRLLTLMVYVPKQSHFERVRFLNFILKISGKNKSTVVYLPRLRMQRMSSLKWALNRPTLFIVYYKRLEVVTEVPDLSIRYKK